ncbi:MAG: WecB/TagA/CpsF family glycosyltransferase [Pseudomonadota bacterium]
MSEAQTNLANAATDATAADDATRAVSDAAGTPAQIDDFDRDVWCLAGIPVDVSTIDQALGALDAAARDRSRLSFVTPNVNWLVRGLREPEFRRQIVDADLSLVDGAPLAALAKLLNVPAPSRVAGADIFDALRRRPGFASRRIKVFFFGGRDGAGEKAVEVINREGGGVEGVGSLNPGHGDIESMSTPEILDEINRAEPDFVLVSLGAKKGQAWIDHNLANLNAPIVAHLGAVVDFAAGSVRRAPTFFQQAGLEWVWRIKEDPALWRRYFEDGLGLMGIGLARVAPQLLSMRQADETEAGDARVEATAQGARVRLTGALTRASLGPVREALRAAAEIGGDIRLDFSQATHFDRAFLGQVLMLEKQLMRKGGTISIEGSTRAQRSMFRANAMNYAIAPAVETDAEDRQPAAA